MRHLVACLLLGGLISGCAHTRHNPDGTVASSEEVAEDATIQKMPGTATDITAPVDSIHRIDVAFNDETEKWVEYFQGRGREHFERYLQRSARYMPMMKKILRENGVPEDLIYIAMIESGFSGKIRSRAKAMGYWQFMKGTGKHYGLRVDSYIDERCDPVKSTEAAASYFKGLYNLFGSWFLAIASYNVGENRIKSVVMKNFTRDFWELARRKQLPLETIHYVPKFLAARQIAMEPEKYGFKDVAYEEAMAFDTVITKEPLDMGVLAKQLDVGLEDIQKLNPAYKTKYIPVFGESAIVRVPQGKQELAQNSLGKCVVKNKKFLVQNDSKALSFLRYRVRRGETLDKIAERYDVEVEDILKLNRIRRARVRPGVTLKIPSSAFKVENKSRTVASSKKPASKSSVHVVKKGDTLSEIAQRYGVPVRALIKENHLAHHGRVMLGQRLTIPD